MQIIKIEVISHNQQRYETCGDWIFIVENTLLIKVSDLKDTKFNMLVAIHELVEALLCKFHNPGITGKEVDEFDFHFEEARGEKDNSEPGDSPDAPYHEQHKVATEIEKIFAKALGVDWDEYSKRVNEL